MNYQSERKTRRFHAWRGVKKVFCEVQFIKAMARIIPVLFEIFAVARTNQFCGTNTKKKIEND